VADKAGASARIGWPAAIAWLATVVAPPTVAGGIWREFVSGHVFLALAIGVAYEVAVAIVGFFVVIARDVSSRWQQRLAEGLDLALRRRFSGFEKRYREFMLAGLRFIDLKGLATIGPFTPELDEVFVDVSLVSRSPHLIQPGVLSELAGPGRRALSEFIRRRQATILAVVGAPGSGKTTLLRHTARHVCLNIGPLRKTDRDIPILLYLRDHSAEIVGNPSVSLVALARNSLGALAQTEPQGWFERQLRNGRCLILLDGFDEVARQSDRAKVADWVGRQVQHHPGNDFVISSRPHGYQTAPVTGAEVVQVCGFTAVQTESFIRGWYQSSERHSTGAEGADIEARARAEADDLLRRLEQAPALHDLTVNPLLLTMIANVHRYRGALPGNRAELYSEICQVMLWRRQDAKNLASQMNGDKKETVLRTLAYSMMDSRVADLPRDDLIAVISPVLRRQSKRVTAESFLADVVTSGLLIERETEQFAFAHHTFQEYLAAGHIRDNALVNILADAVRDPWWRETTLLYAARSDADPIVAACLSANNLTALALAFECVDQDSAFDPALHAHLDELLSSAYDSGSDPARRRLMAGVLLTRHLREQIRTPAAHRLCVQPITHGIYGLFRAETGTPGPDAKHGDGPTDEAIVGVRGGDALAFVEWANTITGGASTYRLPTRDSLDHQMERQAKLGSLVGQHMTCAWADDSDRQEIQKTFLWTPNGVRNAQKSSRQALRSSIERDIVKAIPPNILELIGPGLILMPRVVNNIHSPIGQDDSELAMERAFSYDIILEETRDMVATFADTLRGVTMANDQFSIDFSADLSLALCVVLARMLLQAEQNSRALLRDLIPQISGVLVRDLKGTLARTRTLVTGLASELAQDRATFEQVNDAAIYKIPVSLADSIVSASKEAHAAVALPKALAGALAHRAGIDDGEWDMIIDLDGLSENLGRAMHQYSHMLPAAEGESQDSRLQVITKKLRSEARSVFAREAAVTPQISTSIRLSALLLAGEMNKTAKARTWQYSGTTRPQPRNQAAVLYRNVVAGITWLEGRTNGTDPATEMIMLAIE
jgi:NACHT domain